MSAAAQVPKKGFDEFLKESITAPQGAPAEQQPAERVRPKFTQIRSDQWNELDSLSRELMDKRTGKGRRITSNSLIRIAIDALLAQRAQMVGNDEDELRAHYFKTLGLPEPQTPRIQE